jgi:hypothetical protein
VFVYPDRHRLNAPDSAALRLSEPQSTSRLVRARARLRWPVLLAVVSAVLPVVVRAQQPQSRPDSTPRLGLGASSAINFHAGVGQVKHATLGAEVGGALDIGSIGARRIRLSLGIDYLGMVIDRPDSLGVRDRGHGYVFTAFGDVTFIPSLTRRLTPYVGAGFGIDAVGTTISNEQVGALYNTNVFDVHGQAGAMYRLTPSGHLSLEVRGTGARVVRRVGVRLGYTLFYNQLR